MGEKHLLFGRPKIAEGPSPWLPPQTKSSHAWSLIPAIPCPSPSTTGVYLLVPALSPAAAGQDDLSDCPCKIKKRLVGQNNLTKIIHILYCNFFLPCQWKLLLQHHVSRLLLGVGEDFRFNNWKIPDRNLEMLPVFYWTEVLYPINLFNLCIFFVLNEAGFK